MRTSFAACVRNPSGAEEWATLRHQAQRDANAIRGMVYRGHEVVEAQIPAGNAASDLLFRGCSQVVAGFVRTSGLAGPRRWPPIRRSGRLFILFEESAASGLARHSVGSSVSPSVKRNVAPFSGWLSAQIFPWWRRMMRSLRLGERTRGLVLYAAPSAWPARGADWTRLWVWQGGRGWAARAQEPFNLPSELFSPC